MRTKYTQKSTIFLVIFTKSTISLDSLVFLITSRKYIIETLKYRLKEKKDNHVNLLFISFSFSILKALFRVSFISILFFKTLESSIFDTSSTLFYIFLLTSSLQDRKFYIIIDNFYAIFSRKQ